MQWRCLKREIDEGQVEGMDGVAETRMEENGL